MNVPVLIEALKKLRSNNPKFDFSLSLDYNLLGETEATYEVRVKHIWNEKPAISRMRLKIGEGSSYTSQNIVDTFTDKLQDNFQRIFR